MANQDGSADGSNVLIFLTRARDALCLTDDRLKRTGGSSNHPLHPLLQNAFAEVDDDLAKATEATTNGKLI